ncbi:hypothetical protein KQH42_22455 [Streptomyces sp. CHA1]|uniref:hypothetical protein n=1 Tax=unclassified Streptomyces TaxID=2593676 RepID=UPI001BFC3D95|nr:MULTISPECIES: hypothetical protein [unclassified Streptomyces]MBT3157714.1 hypothetical protein [Streptomyces sp. G11C]MCO6703091.1 hypothetical protein [Streptomyces sp. CHB9.2]MCO6709528.1 hypothetical protein [Streptomyces sp. CHA3]MCO6715271.1 hypothetical protein [Streptomyces sp. CHB19.2]MCO6721396.1 hypothetical protein [Streptomyces sp. Vc714c-19]
MNGSTRDRFRALVPAVTPLAVARFMAGQGWELEKRREGVREIWRYPSDESPGYRYRVMLPLAEDYEDYGERLGDTLIALGRIYDLDPWGLLGSIEAPGVDIISIQLNKNDGDPTVTLIQAKSVVDGFYGLLENAAVRARNPNSTGGGRRAKQVTRYLSDSVHFSRFASEDALSLVVMSQLCVDRLKVVSGDNEGVPYPRQVVRTLMRDLASMRTMTGNLQEETSVSSGLREVTVGTASVKSLASMIDSLDLRSIDFSFQLAAGYEDVEDRDITLSFQRGDLERIPDLKQVLSSTRRRWQSAHLEAAHRRSLEITMPEQTEELILHGPVQGIFRNSDDMPEVNVGGVMVMSIDLGGSKGTVHVRLNEREYLYAIEAHRRNIAVTVRGRLARAGNVVEVYGDSVLDVEELTRSME